MHLLPKVKVELVVSAIPVAAVVAADVAEATWAPVDVGVA